MFKYDVYATLPWLVGHGGAPNPVVESTVSQHGEFNFNIPISLENAHMFHIYSNLRLHNAVQGLKRSFRGGWGGGVPPPPPSHHLFLVLGCHHTFQENPCFRVLLYLPCFRVP